MPTPNYLFLLTSDAYGPHLCTTDPGGWPEMKYALVRDPKYHGVAFEVSQSLLFVKQAADYIRTNYEAHGVEAAVRLTVYERNWNVGGRPEAVHTGRLDYKTYKSLPVGVSISVAEDSLSGKLQTQDGVKVDLLGLSSLGGVALSPPVPVQAMLHSQRLQKQFEAVMGTTPTAGYSGVIFDSDSRGSVLYFGFGEITVNDFNFPVNYTFANSNDEPVAVLPITEAGTYTIDLKLLVKLRVSREGQNGDFDRAEVGIYFRVNNEPPIRLDYDLDTNVGGAYLRYFDGQHQATYDLQAGDNIYIYGTQQIGDVHGNIISGTYQFINEITVLPDSFLRVSATTQTPATQTPGILAHDAFAQVVAAVADQPNLFYSDYYGRTDVGYAVDGEGSLRMITPGFWLRGYPLPSAPAPVDGQPDPRKSAFASLSDLFNGFDAPDCLGMGIEQINGRQRVRIEPRAHFYPATVSLVLGQVTNLSKSPAPDYLYNTAEIGFTQWKPNAGGGQLEFNGKRTYTLPVTVQKATYQALCGLIGAGTLIEQARRQRFDLEKLEDAQNDTENYVVSLRRAFESYASETNEDFSLVEGLLSPETTYNLKLSPGRTLRRHAAFLQPSLYKRPEAKAKITRGAVEGFDGIRTQLLTETQPVDEREDVYATELPAPLFKPEVYEFTAHVRWGLLSALRAKPYGKVSFLDNKNQRLSGYLLRLDYSPASRRAEFKLLRAD